MLLKTKLVHAMPALVCVPDDDTPGHVTVSFTVNLPLGHRRGTIYDPPPNADHPALNSVYKLIVSIRTCEHSVPCVADFILHRTQQPSETFDEFLESIHQYVERLE